MLSWAWILLANKQKLVSLTEIFYAYENENANISWHSCIYQQRKFHAQLSWAWKKFYNLKTSIWSPLDTQIYHF